MKTTDTDRLMVFILCCISFWSTAVIANANEEKATQIIKLWPKDAASQDSKGMGTPKPDRGDGHIRLTDITTPSLRYFPAPATKKLIRGAEYMKETGSWNPANLLFGPPRENR